jgi:dimethylargininase
VSVVERFESVHLQAFTREISPSIVRCELTHLSRVAIDVARARAQHRAYESILEALGYAVTRLPADDDMPDSVFIEDTAVVLPDVAIITRPGAAARGRETEAVAEALAPLRPLVLMTPPATLDGGDVLVVGRTLFVGRTTRTNQAGIDQLTEAAAPFGYQIVTAEPRGCLHLKSAATALDESTVLLDPRCLSAGVMAGLTCLTIDAAEPGAANVLSAAGRVLCAAASPRTADRISRAGFEVMLVETSEVAKAEGALTCCSLLID